MLPTFIIAGAGKSGTTSLWHYLKAHPEVCMSRIKETNFFTLETPAARYNMGLDWYKSLFQDCGFAKAIGEASPQYMARQDTPKLIHQILPKVQLLFILRDPLERLYSQYRSRRKQGEQLPEFEVMVRDRHPALQRYIFYSRYDLHLERYRAYFPRQQVLVLLNEDIRNNSLEFMQNVYRFLGVDPTFIPPNLYDQYNVARRVRAAGLQRFVKSIGTRLMSMKMPAWLFFLLQKGRKAIWTLNTTAVEASPLSKELRYELLPEFSETITYLEKYLDRSLPKWREA
jgi:hypothetical protein